MPPSTRRRAPAVALALALLTAAASAPAQDAYRFYEQAETYFNEGKLQEAVIEIKNALQADPTVLPAYTLLARVYLQVGAAGAAAEAVKKAREMGADSALTWPLQGRALLQQRKYDQLLKTVPTEGYAPEVLSELLAIRGHAHAAKRALAEAEDSYAKALALTPSSPEPHVGLVRVALLKGDPNSAENRAIRALQIIPDAPAVWAIRGDVANVMGDADGALRAYDRAIELDERHVEARLARAGILVTREQLAEAEPDLDSLKETIPLDPRLTYLRALKQGKSGDKAGANEELARARSQLDEMGEEAVRESPQLLMLGAIASFQAGQLERARAYLERYLVLNPRRVDAHKLLSRVLLRQGVAQQAISTLESVLGGAGTDPEFYSLLAEAYTAEGRHDIAGRYLEKALELQPDQDSVRSRYALSQIRTGREAQGLATLESVFSNAPTQRLSVGTVLAAHYLRNRDYDEALRITGQLLDTDPRNLTFLNLHGSALAGAGRTGPSRMTLEEALAINPGYIPAGVNLAKVLAREGDLSGARTVLERLLEARPETVRLMVEIARLAIQDGDSEEARRWLEKARGADPRSLDAALALVDLHLREGRSAEALTVAEEAQAWSPDDERMLGALARVHLAMGRRDLALALYQRLSRAAGFNALAQYRVGRAQAAIGAYDDAVYSLDKGLKDNPDHLPSRMLLVDLLGRGGKTERGIKEAAALREAHPDNPESWRLEAETLGRAGRYGDAITAILRARELKPTTLNTLTHARLLSSAGDAVAAREVVKAWHAQKPDDVPTEVALADSYLATGELAEARRHYESVLAREGNLPVLLNNLAHILDRQGDSGALDLARRAHTAAPDNPAFADTLGWLLVRGGQADEGLRYLRDAHSRSVSNPEIRYHIAQALTALGRDREALDEVREALRLSNSFEGVDEAKALMRRLTP